MRPNLPDRVKIPGAEDKITPFERGDEEASPRKDATPSESSFFEDHPTPTATVRFRGRAPNLSDAANGDAFGEGCDLDISVDGKGGEGERMRRRGTKRRYPFVPDLARVLRRPLAWFWGTFLKLLAWLWGVFWFALKSPFVWSWTKLNRIGEFIVWRVMGLLSSDHGGRNVVGGFKVTDRLVSKVKIASASLFAVFFLWISWFYLYSALTGADEAFVDLPGGLFYSVPERASWEE